MARSTNPNSGGSQFYICLGDAPFLNRQYTVFGHVVEGQTVVDTIRAGDVMTNVTIEAGGDKGNG
jgi:cyclophilin family peptidyl-prolyl cis-trans isomerase